MSPRLLRDCTVLAVLAATALVAASGFPRSGPDLGTIAGPPLPAATSQPDEVRPAYTKLEHRIAMRDGTRLFTSIYTPRTCVAGGYPIMLERTPYGVGPYGADAYRSRVGPSEYFQRDGFIVAYQDVRGRYMSEGTWEEVRPHVPTASLAPGSVTESTDTYDTIEWLVAHLPCNNGRVGMWGISYPGFYVSAGMIDAHPALRAVSPQAPVTDYYLGDDSFHNGAFMLAHNFSFYVRFTPRGPQPRAADRSPPFEYGTPDGYQFYLEAGGLGEMSRRYGLEANPYWMANLEHTTYDAFWQARSIWRHFQHVRPDVLTVGGWFDAENLMGTLRTHDAIRRQSPPTLHHLVMGPWTHGSWESGDGTRLGELDFGSRTAAFYREHIELPFFASRLKDRPGDPQPAAWIFETGANRWREFDVWPPKTTATRYDLAGDGTLVPEADDPGDEAYDEYVSDPNRPVPLVGRVHIGMPAGYMAEDQRFAATRPDVLVYRTEPLEKELTLLGPIRVELHVSTSSTDADFVVKVIDEWPVGSPRPMRAFQQLVRGEPFRGKFRRGFETTVPFTPGQPDVVAFEMPDVAHTFRRGHRLMVHVQSSWFPLVDRNPQVFMHIPDATRDDFTRATHRVYRGGFRRSAITLPVEP